MMALTVYLLDLTPNIIVVFMNNLKISHNPLSAYYQMVRYFLFNFFIVKSLNAFTLVILLKSMPNSSERIFIRTAP